MIISASRRTDIPAFYGDWFANRLREGYVMVRNPFNPKQISRIDLTPEKLDGIVFWSKNPYPMRRQFEALANSGIPFYIQFTLNPYAARLEPGVPPTAERLATFAGLGRMLGRERLVWRYDPIVFSAEYPQSYHEANFRSLAEKLAPYTPKCVVSFLDFYRKTRRNCAGLGVFDPSDAQKFELAGRLGAIGAEFGLAVESCAETIDLAAAGIARARCIDADLLGRLGGRMLKVGRDRNQRPGCGCAASVDLGAYDSCPHGCCYCYANASKARAGERFQAHDPASPFL